MTGPAATSKAKILLIDDSKLIRRAAAKMLERDFDLLLAEDGVRGWQLLKENDDIQVVFSDLMMPNMDGFGLLEKVRSSQQERVRQLPVIIITGEDNSDDAKEQAFKLGATDFVTKPFNATHLKTRARAHVGHQRKTKSLLEQANLDVLTGLPNKQGFEGRLGKDISFIARHEHELAVLLIELDGYRTLYDKVGRKAYDSIIKHIAEVLQRAVRLEDTVARSGLARFTLSLPTAKAVGALALARRICGKIESLTINHRDEPLVVTLSVGVCTVAAGQRPELGAVLECAQSALKAAQLQGGNAVHAQGLDGEVVTGRISLDPLLRELEFNGQLTDDIELDQLALTLKPLVALLSEQQRQLLLD